MASYRYLFADLLTNSILAELPITGVNFTQQLNSIGTLTGHLLLSGVDSTTTNVINATIPGRTAIYVDRDGALVWGGIIWNRTFTSKDQVLNISAREFESYFEKRVITSTTAYTNTDQLTIAQALITNAQAISGGNIGVSVGTETSGVLISKTYYGYELKNVFSAIQDLSKSNAGFDFNVYVYYDSNNNPAKLLRLGYPRYGKTYSSTSVSQPVIELPGNIVAYEYPEDGTGTANYVYATGAGSNEGKTISTAIDGTKIAAGWPVLEMAANYSDQTDATLLGNLAAGQVAAISSPPVRIKAVIPTYADPIFGTYEIGDDIRIRITDDRFPTGLDTYYRLTAYNVTVGEDGPEEVTLTLAIANY